MPVRFDMVSVMPLVMICYQFQSATAAELSALQAGQVIEHIDVFHAAVGTPLATIQAALIAAFNALQSKINAANPWVRYGTSWDGVTWTSVGMP